MKQREDLEYSNMKAHIARKKQNGNQEQRLSSAKLWAKTKKENLMIGALQPIKKPASIWFGFTKKDGILRQDFEYRTRLQSKAKVRIH